MDRRQKYTRMVLKQALSELLQQKHLDKVTVKELCQKADINRTTFYRNYQDVYDLYGDMERELVEQSFESGDMAADRFRMLHVIYENQAFYQEFFHSRLQSSFIQETVERMADQMKAILKERGTYDEKTFPVLYRYNVEGALGVIRGWLDDGCTLPPDELGRILYGIVEKQYR
ncbi:MAG: TetR/AcrR family transcriptional regulator [Eggerthellaceae bacterium]|jgi:AcrR family transcriptional regulator